MCKRLLEALVRKVDLIVFSQMGFSPMKRGKKRPKGHFKRLLKEIFG